MAVTQNDCGGTGGHEYICLSSYDKPTVVVAENALLLVKVMRADLMGKNPGFTEGTSRKIDNLEAEIYNYIRAGRPLKLADLAVNGRNLKAAGIPDGKILGEVLNGLLRRVSAYETENEKELLLREAAAIYEAIRSQEDEGSGDAEKS